MHLPLSGGGERGDCYFLPEFLVVTFEGCHFQVFIIFKTLWYCNTSDYFCLHSFLSCIKFYFLSYNICPLVQANIISLTISCSSPFPPSTIVVMKHEPDAWHSQGAYHSLPISKYHDQYCVVIVKLNI